MKVTNEISEFIFRGYDIRGIYGDDLNEDITYTIGLAFGTKLINEGKKETVVGYDNRSSSPSLYNALTKGITSTGVNVINIGLVTTPMYYYALTLFNADSGTMITASHNPKDHNGFKMTFNGYYNSYGEHIQEFKDQVKKQEFIYGNGSVKNEDIRERYINHVTSSIKLGPNIPKLVIDCGNGTGSIIVEDVFKKLNIPYIPIFCDSDPDFPNHHPDPSVEENLIDLKNKVLETHSNIGFSLDGDADRIGLVDEFGNMVNIDEFMIIIIRDILHKLPNKNILFDVKCSKALEDEIIKLGGNPICYRTGNSYMRAKLVSENILFAGELSGHVFFNDKFNGFDDGIYAILRMIEILSHTNKKTSELLEGITKYYSTRENKITVTDDNKFPIIDEVINYCNKKEYKTLTIDGCKVLFEDGFALIRASNTGPNLTTRYEAKTEDRLSEIKLEFETILASIINK